MVQAKKKKCSCPVCGVFAKIVKSSLFKRIFVSLLLIPAVLAILFAGYPYVQMFVMMVGFLLAWEWATIVPNKRPLMYALSYAGLTTVFVFTPFFLPMLLSLLFVSVLLWVKSRGEEKRKLLMLGAFYIPVGLASVVLIYDLFGPLTCLWFLLVVWCTDIGGMLFGKTIGGPKLAPKISPNKTWAGLIGGMIMAGAVSCGYAYLFGGANYLLFYTIVAALTAVIAQIGDLCESAIKRNVGVKDSSNLIPGHGGVFDRIDGIVFAAPVLLIGYFVWALWLSDFFSANGSKISEYAINTLYYVVPFILILGVLVFVHELGHYVVAKLSGVKIEAFSIGFGKKLLGFTDKSGTQWKICMIPLGGYVQMFGDADPTSASADKKVKELSEEEKKKAFNFQPAWKKLLIALAGPVSNYVFAIAIFTMMFMAFGKMDFPPVVGEVMPNSAAATANLQAKDKILSVNGKKTDTFEAVRYEVALAVDGKIVLEIERNGKKIVKNVTLLEMQTEENGAKEKRKMLGIKSVNATEVTGDQMTFVPAVAEAVKESWRITEVTLRGVAQIIKGDRGGEEIGGIVRIAEMSGDISKNNNVLDLLMFMALLSINLGLINLFPIPALDGGHVLFSLVEIVTRKQINEKAKEFLLKIGISLLLALLVFATWNDFVRLFNRWFS